MVRLVPDAGPGIKSVCVVGIEDFLWTGSAGSSGKAALRVQGSARLAWLAKEILAVRL
jgi:hypothetical protein